MHHRDSSSGVAQGGSEHARSNGEAADSGKGTGLTCHVVRLTSPMASRRAMAQQGKGTRLSDFDGYYAGVYGHDRWQSLRAKLPEPSSQVGLVNRLVPEAEVEMAMPSAKTVKLTPGLEVGQPPGSSLPRAPSGLAVTYGMDLASLLPTLALDPQPGERVLDACASPGGKALAVLNRLLWSEGKAGEEGGSDPTLTSHLTVNEPSLRRLKRLKGILSDFVPLHLRHSCTQVLSHDATKWHHHEPASFDKVLVDAPCSSDRHVVQQRGDAASVRREDWSVARLKRDAKLQTGLLEAAIGSTRPGGRVVYATCSLSPVQNDAVVAKATRRAGGMPSDDRPCLHAAQILPGTERTQHGFIALPDATGNGPIYFCAISV